MGLCVGLEVELCVGLGVGGVVFMRALNGSLRTPSATTMQPVIVMSPSEQHVQVRNAATLAAHPNCGYIPCSCVMRRVMRVQALPNALLPLGS